MELPEELELLVKRRDELKTIANNVRDIFEFFEKNEISMVSTYDHSRLEDLADELSDEASEIDIQIDDLNDEVNDDWGGK